MSALLKDLHLAFAAGGRERALALRRGERGVGSPPRGKFIYSCALQLE